ncbi:hypothetical protein [Pseudofulvibacter geojedonensis]|uniref:Uncharacterized protein n=1 Tax=Pseudofulvibacter geojedonensis TaxID=1123758 RepID=A0ABW3I4A6_9FLAO
MINILKKIFGVKKQKDTSEKTTYLKLEKFKSKNSDDRMSDIIILGNTGNPEVFEVLEYAIMNDTDSGVVMSGLKRLPNFRGDERLLPLLEKLKTKTDIKKYEPYYSMALLNLNIIDENEFNEIFKK